MTEEERLAAEAAQSINPERALTLLRVMQELSGRSFAAGWQIGLEYALWEVVLRDRTRYGAIVFTFGEASHMRVLAQECRGWWIWRDDFGETFLPLGDWQDRYDTWVRRHGRALI